ncbi:12912_t:CDS:2 [Acaulospora morrowiae]|uniref:12912_t:CDS:1 n=1 Tax=Acaulospora morrowiae TaxID=94023 RepID=A0A9N8Z9V4_9GLOM|nr:12912_t:CDS:2 [Acaulospora morrowiae]
MNNEKDSEPSDDVKYLNYTFSKYDTNEEELDIYFEKIKDPYINRKSEAKNFNKEKIGDIYKRELTLKDELKIRIVLIAYMKKITSESQKPIYKIFPFKYETIEIIREDQINTIIEKEYNEIIDQIENEAIQESG